MKRTSSIKRQIFLINYLIPLIVFIIAFVVGSFGNVVSNAVYIFFLAVAFAVLLLTTKKKYIHSVEFHDNAIEIEYYNVFFKSIKQIIPISLLSDIDTAADKLSSKYSCTLQIKVEGDRFKYEILEMPMKHYILQNLSAIRLTHF